MRRSEKVEKPNVRSTDPYVRNLLQNITHGKTLLHFRKNQKIFSQGEKAGAIYFIDTGKVKITAVSENGREAVLALLGGREFFGEACLAGQSLRTDTATALEPSILFRVEKHAMLDSLQAQPQLSDRFIAGLLKRNVRFQEELCNQFFNNSERRLARALVKLARESQHTPAPDIKLPRLSHETLAEIVGTTRSRITQFMNKFRKMGLIEYKGGLTIRAELLTDVCCLRD
jgi:CRP-like cAMP-binding protein